MLNDIYTLLKTMEALFKSKRRKSNLKMLWWFSHLVNRILYTGKNMLTANENILHPHKHNRWYAKEKVAKLFEPIVWILFLKHGISKNPLIVNIKMFKKLIISRLLGMGGLGISSPWMDMADSFRLGWFSDKFVVGFRISSWIWKRWLGKPERSKHKKNGYLSTFQAYINKKNQDY